MADNELVTSIVYETDQSSVNEAKKAAQDVGKTIKGVDDQINDLGKNRGINQATQGLDEMRREFLKANDAAGELVDTIRKDLADGLNDAAKKSQDIDVGGKGGFSPNKFRGVASAFGGGDAIGAVDDIQDAIEGVKELGTSLTAVLVPAMAGGKAGIAAMAGAALPIVAILGAAALAIKAYTDEAARQADELNAIIDNRRDVADAIAGGMTAEDAQKQIAALEERRALEEDILADSTAAYEGFIQGIRDQFGLLAPLFEGVFKIFDNREEALATQINESNKLIEDSKTKQNAYNNALEDGKFKANDAAKAHEEAAKVQVSSASESARAAESSAREQASAAKEAQRAQEQAAKEVANAYKQIEDSNRKYDDAIKKINRDSTNAVKDIHTRAADTAKAEAVKFGNDIAALTVKAHQAEYDAGVKAYRDEAQALKDYHNNVKKLTQDAANAQLDAQENRNFLEFAQAQKERQRSLDAEGQDAVAAKEAREQQRKDEATDRNTELDRARQERRQASREQQAMDKVATETALRDAKVAKQRQLVDARDSYNAEQRQLQAHLQGLGGLRAQFYQSETQMAQSALSALRGGGGGQPGSFGRNTSIQPGNITSSSSVTNIDNRRSSATINGNNTAALYEFLKNAGYA